MQVKLEALDGVDPMSLPNSSKHARQRERLLRDDFFRDCLAPKDAHYKVCTTIHPLQPRAFYLASTHRPFTGFCLACMQAWHAHVDMPNLQVRPL